MSHCLVDGLRHPESNARTLLDPGEESERKKAVCVCLVSHSFQRCASVSIADLCFHENYTSVKDLATKAETCCSCHATAQLVNLNHKVLVRLDKPSSVADSNLNARRSFTTSYMLGVGGGEEGCSFVTLDQWDENISHSLSLSNSSFFLPPSHVPPFSCLFASSSSFSQSIFFFPLLSVDLSPFCHFSIASPLPSPTQFN